MNVVVRFDLGLKLFLLVLFSVSLGSPFDSTAQLNVF